MNRNSPLGARGSERRTTQALRTFERLKTRTALLLALLASALVIAWAVFLYGWSMGGFQATVRFSGRLSLFVFALIFLLYPKNESRLAQFLSADFFLVFALVHGIHLVELLTYVTKSGIPLVPTRLAGGFLAYALIFAMPWLKYRVSKNQLSMERFTRIGYVYLFYVWFVFFMTYLARVRRTFPNAGGTYAEHAGLMGVVILLLIIKIVEVVRGGNRGTSGDS